LPSIEAVWSPADGRSRNGDHVLLENAWRDAGRPEELADRYQPAMAPMSFVSVDITL